MSTGSQHISEQELLQRIATGDQHAFTIIFEKYWDQVFSASLVLTKSTQLSQDVAQEVFTRIWMKRASLPFIDHLEGYLFIIARNLIYGRLKKEAVEEKYLLYIKDYFHDISWSPDMVTESRELEQVLLDAMSQFPPQQQKAFRLSRYRGMSYEEISLEMGIAKNTVKSYIAESLSTLRRIAERHTGKLLALLTFLFFKK